jgi:hypothetical protein
MQSLENFIRKIEKEAIKSSIDVSDIIPSDTLNIFTQDESSIEKQKIDYLISDHVSLLNKLYAFSKWYSHDDAHFSELTEYLEQTKDLIESKVGGRFDLLVDEKLQEGGFKLSPKKRFLVHAKFQDCVLAKINEKPLPFEPEAFTKIKELLSLLTDKKRIIQTAKLVAQDMDQLAQAKNVTIHVGRKKIPFKMNDQLLQVIREEHALHDPFIEYIQQLTQWDEPTARKEYANMLESIAPEIAKEFSIQKKSITQVDKILFEYTKKTRPSGNKQQVYDLIHAVLEPFYSELHAKDEYPSVRSHAAYDPKTYRQHKRDSIRGLMR